MSLWELFVIAVGLSMDAFAVAICKGLSVGRVRGSHAVTAGIYFGGFQMLMPLSGLSAGGALSRDHRQEWTTGSPSSCWG